MIKYVNKLKVENISENNNFKKYLMQSLKDILLNIFFNVFF